MSVRLPVIILFISLLILAASAAETATRPALLPIVDVTKTDGTVLHGRLVNADGLELTVQPTAAGQAAQSLAWRDVKRVSTGLTQQKAADAWKALHKDDICTTCKGDRMVLCATCKGTGHDLASRKECKVCKGTGTTACTAAHCDKGQIPCTGPCLKLSSGSWSMQDGKRVRTFPTANGGTFWISEGHLGQVVEIKNGFATGQTTTCPLCHGKSTIDCTICHGTGQEVCKECIRSTAPACPAECDHGMTKCTVCEGTGLKKK